MLAAILGDEISVLVIGIILGILFAISIFIAYLTSRTYGIMHIDVNDPCKEKYLMEITKNVEEIKTKRLIVLHIDPDADLSEYPKSQL